MSGSLIAIEIQISNIAIMDLQLLSLGAGQLLQLQVRGERGLTFKWSQNLL